MHIYIKNSEADIQSWRIQDEKELATFLEYLQAVPHGHVGLCINDDGSNPKQLWLTVGENKTLNGYPIRRIENTQSSIVNVYFRFSVSEKTFTPTPNQGSARYKLTAQDETSFFSDEAINDIKTSLAAPATEVVSHYLENTTLTHKQQDFLFEGLIMSGDPQHPIRTDFKSYYESLEPDVLKAIIQDKEPKHLSPEAQERRETVLATFFNPYVLDQICNQLSSDSERVTRAMIEQYYIAMIQRLLIEKGLDPVPKENLIPISVDGPFTAERLQNIKVLAPRKEEMSETERELYNCLYLLLSLSPNAALNLDNYLSQSYFKKHLDRVHAMLKDINAVIKETQQTTQLSDREINYSKVYDEILASFGVDGWENFKPIVSHCLSYMEIDSPENLSKHLTDALKQKNWNLVQGIIHKKTPPMPSQQDFQHAMTTALQNHQWILCSELINSNKLNQHIISNALRQIVNQYKFSHDKHILIQMIADIMNLKDNKPTPDGFWLSMKSAFTAGLWEIVSILRSFMQDQAKTENEHKVDFMVTLATNKTNLDRLIIDYFDNAITDGIAIPKEVIESFTNAQIKSIFNQYNLDSFLSSSSTNEAKLLALTKMEESGLLASIFRDVWKAYKQENPHESGRLMSALFCNQSDARMLYTLTQRAEPVSSARDRVLLKLKATHQYIEDNPQDKFAEKLNRIFSSEFIKTPPSIPERHAIEPSNSSDIASRRP